MNHSHQPDPNKSPAILKAVKPNESNTQREVACPTDAVLLKESNCEPPQTTPRPGGSEEYIKDLMEVLDRGGMTQAEEYTQDLMNVFNKGLRAHLQRKQEIRIIYFS